MVYNRPEVLVPNPILSPPQSSQTTELYDRDFYLWTETMVEVLRSGNLAELDIANLAEEVESLGRRDKRELQSRLVVLLHHLLKWQFQPSMRWSTTDRRSSGSWRGTLAEQRLRMRRLLNDSPSLRSVLESSIEECYADAKVQTSEETSLAIDTFPADCPYQIEAILNIEFLPD